MADEAVSGQSGNLDPTALNEIASNGQFANQAIGEVTKAIAGLTDIVLPASRGGTGIRSYTIGDLLYADSTTSLAKLADVAIGNVLVSGGIGSVPSWGKVTPSHFSGVLPVANGGTGTSSQTPYAVICGGTTTTNPTQSISSVGTAGQLLTSNGAGALPTMSSRGAAASDYQGNTTNLLFITPNTVWAATAFTALTDAATIAVDMATGFNFSVSIAGDRSLGNPTNPKVGQSGVFSVTASGGARNLSRGSNYKSTSGIVWPIPIASGQTAYVFFFVVSATFILITSVLNNPT